MSQSDFARAKGVSCAAVAKMIRTGRVETNGKKGRDCRVREKTEATSLEAARIEKIKADVELQRQKLSSNIDLIRREAAEIVMEEFIQAATPFKIWVTELRLSPKQTEIFRKHIDEMAASLQKRVATRLNEEPGR